MASCCARLTTLPVTPPLLHKVLSFSCFSAAAATTAASASRQPLHFTRLLCISASASSSPSPSPSPSVTLDARPGPSFRNVIDVLEERGLIESVTHEDIRSACSKPTSSPVKVYCGFDPTAESLHLGNLLGLIVLSWFQRCGHVPVALLGGATARVGDPSGKSVERPSMDEPTIENNLKGVRANIEQVLKVHTVPSLNSLGQHDGNTINAVQRPGVYDVSEVMNCSRIENSLHPALVMNNYDWWKEFSLLQFLRDVGKYARVGSMVAKESVKKRLNSEEGLSFTEFTYQLLQGYDFVHLFQNEGVSIQIGGSDQWGNITAGTDLIRKILHQDGAFGLTFPLLLKSDGSKFGKSEGGAIWLSPSMLSPYKFYQHLFATPDADIITFLKRLTFLSIEEIQALQEDMTKLTYVPNSAQKVLAEEVTRFVHGEEGLTEAIRATEALAPGGTTRLDWRAIESIASDLPSFSTSHSDVLGSTLVDLCVTAGLLPTKAAVRRLIKQGGFYLNNERVDDEKKVLEAVDIVDNRMLLLSAGKKNKMVIRVQ